MLTRKARSAQRKARTAGGAWKMVDVMRAGEKAKRAGSNRTPPYPETDDRREFWLDGYDDPEARP